MRLAIISDLHANLEAYRAIAPQLRMVDRVICLGDLVGYYCQVNEVIDLVRGLNPICVMGNHDHFLLTGCPPDAPQTVRFGIEYANRIITVENREWLASLPLVWGGRLGGRSLLLTHGSPWRPLHDYVYDDSPLLPELSKFDFDIVAFGQTHRLLVTMGSLPLRLNPGSVGQPRDVAAKASALIVDLQTLTVETLRCSFEPRHVIECAVKEGAGTWITKHLM